MPDHDFVFICASDHPPSEGPISAFTAQSRSRGLEFHANLDCSGEVVISLHDAAGNTVRVLFPRSIALEIAAKLREVANAHTF